MLITLDYMIIMSVVITFLLCDYKIRAIDDSLIIL